MTTVREPPLPPGIDEDRLAAIANRLNSTAIHLLRRIGRDDAVDGVTGPRLSALSVIVYGGPHTAGELARRERVTLPTMTRTVDALVRDGLLAREGAPGDRRVVRLVATAEGTQLMERGRARRIRRLTAELSRLGSDELDALERGIAVLGVLEDGRREEVTT